MIITKKNQVEHKIIKLDRFRRSSTKLVSPNVQNEPITIPYQPHHHLQQTNQLQFQDKPIQYYTNNNFIYNNVSPVQFPQSFIETNQTQDIPLNKSKSISFIAYNTQCQKDLQNESEVNGNVLLLTPACTSSNYVYNKTPSKIGENALSKSKQSLQTVQQESKWNMVIMPCKNENMEIVREVNEGGYNCNSNNNKENSTMFQTEHSQLIIENTPSRTNYNNGQMLLREIYESGNDDNVETIKREEEEEEHKEEDDVALFKGDVNVKYEKKSDNNINTTNNKDNSKTPINCNSNISIPMRNILPFNKSITPLFSNTNPTSSLEAHNTSSSYNKINTILINPLNSSQKHHATPSLQIHNLKRFHTERSNTNSISNNFLLETISFNHHHSPKAINPQMMNSNSKQIRAIILKESITEVNKHKPQQLEVNKTNAHINTYSNNVNNEMSIHNCIEPSSSNRVLHDEYLSSSPHTTKSNKSKLIKVNGNQTQMRNVGVVKGKSFLTPKGNENDKKNILFPSFLKNDKIAIMKYKNLLKNTSGITTPPSTPCATNNNKVNTNIQQTNIEKHIKHNNNLSNRDKKQITTTTTTKTSSCSKGKNILDNKTKYQNVINSFYSSTDIPRLSYKHSFVETKRTGLNLNTKLALPANNFDTDKDRNSNYIHI